VALVLARTQDAGVLGSFASRMQNAWVLLVEILR
jgi:hypothetical protein